MENVPRSSGLQISTVKMLVLTIPLLTPTSILASENIELQAALSASSLPHSNKIRKSFVIFNAFKCKPLSGMLIECSDYEEEQEVLVVVVVVEDLEM